MPHTASSSSHLTKPRRSKKDVVFGSVEVIPDFPGPKSGRGKPSSSLRVAGYKLKRSPTPVLTSLTDLTNAHLSQLSGVWNEKNLPNFEADKRSIAATRQEMDPFDF